MFNITRPMRPITHKAAQTIQGQRTQLALYVLMDPGVDPSFIHQQVILKGAIPKIIRLGADENSIESPQTIKLWNYKTFYFQNLIAPKTSIVVLNVLLYKSSEKKICHSWQWLFNSCWHLIQWRSSNHHMLVSRQHSPLQTSRLFQQEAANVGWLS